MHLRDSSTLTLQIRVNLKTTTFLLYMAMVQWGARISQINIINVGVQECELERKLFFDKQQRQSQSSKQSTQTHKYFS